MENLNINLSTRLNEILVKIASSSDDKISRFVLNLEGNNDYTYPFSYIDITENEDQVSFIQINKYKQITETRHPNLGELLWSGPYRNEIKIGRLIIKLAPIFKPFEIEKFVNLYKAEYKDSIRSIKFKVVEGEDIVKYYNGGSYARGNGSLNKSCMRHDQCAQYMDLYKMNPDKIKLLILLDKKGLINGRALLWKLDGSDNFLMDRIYTREDSDTILFKKHAEKNGWLYKNNQTFDAVNVIQGGKECFVEMRVTVKGDFRYFPYIDTLLYYDKKNKFLTNVEKYYSDIPTVVKLREINGKDSGNENFVYDILNDTFINVEDSIFCFYGDSYTHKNNAYFIKKLDEFCLPTNLRYSTHQKIFISSENSVYSYNLKSFVDSNLVISVFLTKDKKRFDYFLKKDCGKVYDHRVDGNLYLLSLLIKGEDGKYYFEEDIIKLKKAWEEAKEKAEKDKKKNKKKSIFSKKSDTSSSSTPFDPSAWYLPNLGNR